MQELCHRCSSELSTGDGSNSFCPHCGAPLMAGAKFCVECGKAVGDGAVGAAAAGAKKDAPPSPPSTTGVQLTTAFIVVFLSIAIVILFVSRALDDGSLCGK